VNAVVAAEKSVVAEDRIARLESDVSELKGDVKTLTARIGEWIIANAKELANLRTEMEKGFGMLRIEIERNRTEIEKNRTEIEKSRTEIEKNRADTERGFGALKASIESAKLWMLVTGVGSVILVTFVTFLGRALKVF
jgi:DNA repair exonuclease SbcCD ATPase subunit